MCFERLEGRCFNVQKVSTKLRFSLGEGKGGEICRSKDQTGEKKEGGGKKKRGGGSSLGERKGGISTCSRRGNQLHGLQRETAAEIVRPFTKKKFV